MSDVVDRNVFVPGPHHMEIASGAYLDLMNPDPADITLEDIAHHLSLINRYTGASARPISVAEHAVLVATRLRVLGWDNATILMGLHHDNGEAFAGDIGRPLKLALGAAYSDVEDRVADACRKALRLYPDGNRRAVKDADDWALAAEAWFLLPSRGEGWFCWGLFDMEDPNNPPGTWRLQDATVHPAVARDMYLAEHRRIVADWRAERSSAAAFAATQGGTS